MPHICKMDCSRVTNRVLHCDMLYICISDHAEVSELELYVILAGLTVASYDCHLNMQLLRKLRLQATGYVLKIYLVSGRMYWNNDFQLWRLVSTPADCIAE